MTDEALFHSLPEQEQMDYVIYDANRLDNALSHNPSEGFRGTEWQSVPRIGFSGEKLGDQFVLTPSEKGILTPKEVQSLQTHMIELFHRRFISYGEHGYIDQTIQDRLASVRAELKGLCTKRI